jgi:hypothetical protein
MNLSIFTGMIIFNGRLNVSCWHKAEIPPRSIDVRFRGQSGHRNFIVPCPLMTLNGHCPIQLDHFRSAGLTRYDVLS